MGVIIQTAMKNSVERSSFIHWIVKFCIICSLHLLSNVSYQFLASGPISWNAICLTCGFSRELLTCMYTYTIRPILTRTNPISCFSKLWVCMAIAILLIEYNTSKRHRPISYLLPAMVAIVYYLRLTRPRIIYVRYFGYHRLRNKVGQNGNKVHFLRLHD